jgi:hypothetical protein
MARSTGVLTFVIAALASAGPARAEDAGYEVVLSVRPPSTDHDRPTVSLSILPHAGYQLLGDGPLVVRLRGDGVTPARTLYRRDDAVDPRAEAPRFELAFRRDRPGAAHLDAELTFYICAEGPPRARRCRPVDRVYGTSL